MEKKMQFNVRLDTSAHLVRCTVTGTIRVHRLESMAAETLTMARAHSCHASLIDVTDATSGDSLMETFEFMAHLEALGLQHTDFVADVYTQDASNHTFAETVARNRGWTNVRYFTMPGPDKIAGFYMGPDGYCWGREAMDVVPESHLANL